MLQGRVTTCQRQSKSSVIGLLLHTQSLPYILDDTIPEERALAMEFGMKLLSMSTRVVVFGSQISSGMDQEIRAAQNLGIPVFYRAGLQESLKCTEVVT